MLYATKTIVVTDNEITSANHKTARTNLSISQRALANALGIVPGKLSKLENNKCPWTKEQSADHCIGMIDIVEKRLIDKLQKYEESMLLKIEELQSHSSSGTNPLACLEDAKEKWTVV